MSIKKNNKKKYNQLRNEWEWEEQKKHSGRISIRNAIYGKKIYIAAMAAAIYEIADEKYELK